ncbi:MAG: hypothetical protein LBV43_06390 [Prevotella sp.]|jgi:hypothetical protein|nr:hypothetical protein [Prevotella sp.]
MMKKILSYILCFPVLFLNCSTDVDDSVIVEKTNFPAQSEEYGKAVAKEFRTIVKNLNEMGVDYSDADNSEEFKARLYEDLYKASPVIKKMKTSFAEVQKASEISAERFNNLTEIQIEFAERIIKECGESTSYQDLFRKLISINKEIYTQVPPIEQERLFNVTAVLYYGFNEIQNLERQGQMFLTPHNKMVSPRLKGGSEPDPGGGTGGSCRQITSAIGIFVVGAITTAGETVISVTALGAVGFVLVVLCIPGDTDWGRICRGYSTRCIEKGWHQGRKMECDQCYRYCVNNFGWNWASCPLD